jgi:hypothetical protein
MGRVEEAEAIVDSVEAAISQGTAADPLFTDVTRAEDLAVYYGWTGDAREALRWLTAAYDLSPSGIEIRVLESSLFDPVRDDSAFARGVEQVRSRIWPRVRAEADRLRTW